MNPFRILTIVFGLSLILLLPLMAVPVQALAHVPAEQITEWEMIWEEEPSNSIQDVIMNMDSAKWQRFSYNDDLPEKPEGIQTAWLRFQLPEFELARPALLISKLTARDVSIFIGDKLVYESSRTYLYNKNEILLPLDSYEANQMVYLRIFTESDWLGMKKYIELGEHQTLSKGLMKRDMMDVVLGTSLVFIAVAMLLIIIFLNHTLLTGWVSLCVVILSIGLMIISYSPYLHTIYWEYGFIIYYLFDIALFFLMPAMFHFFEKIFGRGPAGVFQSFRKVYSVITILLLLFLAFSFTSKEMESLYVTVSLNILGFSLVIGNIVLLISLVYYCVQKNKEALIITVGYGVFAGVGILEIIWYFANQRNYNMFLWKWGILFFIASLVIILARRILKNYEQLVKYSKQLEIFNNELQRSEKMEIISQLAASVAHEVRNPLQVTRGFLQLLREKTTNEKERGFMILAMDELDRASDIITDFLTFAKPQLDQTTLLDIRDELEQIEGILMPLATMQGGIITVDLASELYIRGNSSKFKQAIINVIKNSIEALTDDGLIMIRAYLEEKNKRIVIRIKDNGEGMHEADLKRLGEPYYSKKTKGTGLGLMVTYRIIEAMQGTIEFTSKKSIGTEVIIQFPSAEE